MIRPAAASDAAAIAAIWNPIIRDTKITFTTDEKSEAEIAQMIASRACFLVAEAQETTANATVPRFCGFASFAPFRAGPGYARTLEHTVILGPEARGRGLGRALLERLISEARAQGAHSLIGGVSGANPAAIAFHQALGFAQVAILPEVGWKFGSWLDLHLLQKRL